MAAFPAAFYLYGLAKKNTPAQNTVLLAGEAVLDSEILTSVFKDIDRRLRPNQLPANGDFSDTWFRAHGHLKCPRLLYHFRCWFSVDFWFQRG
jgi:hypothetical protein